MSIPRLALAIICASGAALAQSTALCGDCDGNRAAPTVLDALVAAQLQVGTIAPSAYQTCQCDVDASSSITIIDALLIAQAQVGLPVILTCECAILSACRAVDRVGTTAPGPHGVNPPYIRPGTNGGPGGWPLSGDIADSSLLFTHFRDFDYQDSFNQGEFVDAVTLVDRSGAVSLGNPVILMSAGHDYGFGACNPVSSFQAALEGAVVHPDGGLFDLAQRSTPVSIAGQLVTISTRWAAALGNVSVSADGLISAIAGRENVCDTISWSLTSSDPILVIDPVCAAGSFSACVDSGGIDDDTRTLYLPVGDVDATLPGLPSGAPPPGVGGEFGVTAIANFGAGRGGAFQWHLDYDCAVVQVDRALDRDGIGEPAVRTWTSLVVITGACPVTTTTYSAANPGGSRPGISDIGGVNFIQVGAGACLLQARIDNLGTSSGFEVRLGTPCLAPLPRGYSAIAGTATILLLP